MKFLTYPHLEFNSRINEPFGSYLHDHFFGPMKIKTAKLLVWTKDFHLFIMLSIARMSDEVLFVFDLLFFCTQSIGQITPQTFMTVVRLSALGLTYIHP